MSACPTCSSEQYVKYQGLMEVEYGCKQCEGLESLTFVAGVQCEPGELVYLNTPGVAVPISTAQKPRTIAEIFLEAGKFPFKVNGLGMTLTIHRLLRPYNHVFVYEASEDNGPTWDCYDSDSFTLVTP